MTFHATGVLAVALAIGFFSWMALARLVRAEFLTLREREFVDAARVAGASSGRIIRHHILPNCVSVIVVNATLTMSAAILVEAALSFLGFGIQYPNVSLGSLISNYQTAMLTNEGYLFIWPGIFIIIIVMSLNFIGDGVRDAYDPRQKRIPKKRELVRKAPKGSVAARGRRSITGGARRCDGGRRVRHRGQAVQPEHDLGLEKQRQSGDDRERDADRDQLPVPSHRSLDMLKAGIIQVPGLAQLLPAAGHRGGGITGRRPGQLSWPDDAAGSRRTAGLREGRAGRDTRSGSPAPGPPTR